MCRRAAGMTALVIWLSPPSARNREQRVLGSRSTKTAHKYYFFSLFAFSVQCILQFLLEICRLCFRSLTFFFPSIYFCLLFRNECTQISCSLSLQLLTGCSVAGCSVIILNISAFDLFYPRAPFILAPLHWCHGPPPDWSCDINHFLLTGKATRHTRQSQPWARKLLSWYNVEFSMTK